MSRKEVIGEKYTIAFGVDLVTGAFAQLWLNPTDEQDCALVRIDSDGASADPKVEPEVQRYVNSVIKRFKDFQLYKPGQRPNISETDVIDLARVAGGFPDIAAEVYRVFGDDA